MKLRDSDRAPSVKDFFALLSALSLILLTIVPILVSSSELTSHRWRLAVAVVAAVALAALFFQLRIQSREERESRQQAENLAKMIERLTGQAAKGPEQAKAKIAAPSLVDSPRVYVDIKSGGNGLFSKTVFTLINHGRDIAHRVRLEPLTLNSGKVVFAGVETLAVGESKEVLATIMAHISVLSRHNLNSLLMREWDSAGNLTSEFPISMRVQYEDVRHNRFETIFDLVYLPVKDIVARNPFEVRNLEIRASTPPVA